MSDLISRSALIESIEEEAETRLLGYESGISLGEMKEWVENQPTVEAINEFAKWCYLHGIDFSYMTKGTDTESFCTTVIKKFNADMRGDSSD